MPATSTTTSAPRLLLACLGFAAVVVFSGFDNPFLLVGIPGLGFFLPRFFLKRMIQGPPDSASALACPTLLT